MKKSQVQTGGKDDVPLEKLDRLGELVLQLCVADVLAGLHHLPHQLLQQPHRPDYAALQHTQRDYAALQHTEGDYTTL